MKKNIIIIALLVLVLGLGCFIVYDRFFNKESENISNTDNEQQVIFKEYKKGEEVELSDGSKWLVLKDSDKSLDYVVLFSYEDFSSNVSESDYDKLFKELLTGESFDFNKSYVKEYLESKKDDIPVKYKTINDHDIRLITLNEVLEYDNNWKLDGTTHIYEYSGTKLNDYFNFYLTMTPYIYGGKGGPVYIGLRSSCYDDSNCTETYSIGHWAAGLGGLKPVINALKSSI